MAASLFGAFELGAALRRSRTASRRSAASATRARSCSGSCAALIAAPCTGPVLTGILTWIAQTKSVPLGALAMTAFALGLGAPFFVVGRVRRAAAEERALDGAREIGRSASCWSSSRSTS